MLRLCFCCKCLLVCVHSVDIQRMQAMAACKQGARSVATYRYTIQGRMIEVRAAPGSQLLVVASAPPAPQQLHAAAELPVPTCTFMSFGLLGQFTV